MHVVQTFTAWCNHWLKAREMKLERLERDLSSGVALCHLLELLSGERLRGPNFHLNPRIKIHNLENLNLSFSFMEKKRIILVNIGPEGTIETRASVGTTHVVPQLNVESTQLIALCMLQISMMGIRSSCLA